MDTIRDGEFSARLDRACIDYPPCPTGAYRGKQKWLRESLEDLGPEFKVSAESVRKWFAGKSRPRPKMMRALATVLSVDEAWLALGLVPDMTPKDRRKRVKSAEGGAMLLAGLIQLSGGHTTFPVLGEVSRPDLLAIIDGEAIEIDAPLARTIQPGTHRFTIKREYESRQVVCVIPNGFGARLLLINKIVIRNHGARRGDYLELEVSETSGRFFIGTEELPEITHLEMLTEQ